MTQEKDDALERVARRKLIVVSNREPVVHTKRAGRVVETRPAGGLRTALEPLAGRFGATWVAHGSGDADFEVTDARDRVRVEDARGRPYTVRRVRLGPEVERGYYYGFANEGLWPLCHIAYTEPVFRASDWAHYQEANRIFAQAILEEVGHDPAFVIINDYHLALVPRLLRAERPDLLLAHFWHIPWPSPEVMRICPPMPVLLDGLLGNDLIGFHIQSHCNNFLETVDVTLEAIVDWEHHRVQRRGQRSYVRPFPISIDTAELSEDPGPGELLKRFPELAPRLDGKTVLLGVDRLDYTKGIPHRLRAYEAMLAAEPSLVGATVLVQVAAPSRSILDRYRSLADEVAALVEGINRRFGRDDWRPVEYLNENVDRRGVTALMRRADACLVTSLHDGMNLVAKEYVVARQGRPSTLVLSRFTGAARELPEACLVNPYDFDGTAKLILASLRLPDDMRAEAMGRMLSHINEHDIEKWLRDLLHCVDGIERSKEAAQFPGNV